MLASLYAAVLLSIAAIGESDTLNLRRGALGGQGSGCRVHGFEDRRYFDPLAAEPRAAQVNALAIARGRPVDFLLNDKDTRTYWDIDVGTEMPIVSRSCSDVNGRAAFNALSFGYWIAIDFHMLQALDDPSSPILNTDYRFAFANLKLQYGLSDSSQLGVRLQLGHESTHLGDEYSLSADSIYPDFRRFNVSYEWIDLAIALDQHAGLTSWRLGVVTTLPFRETYYTGDIGEVRGTPIAGSSNWWEPYGGFQRRFQPRLYGKKREIYISTDARWKTIYDYDRAPSSGAEDRQLSVNVLIGAAGTESSAQGGLRRVSPYFRYYYGVNPHGQFRNQRSFRLVGLGLRLHR